MICIDKSLIEDGITTEVIKACIDEHSKLVDGKYKILDDYYAGEHKILNRSFENSSIPNNRIVCNHAEYISDMATGYVFGTPITYSGDGADVLNDIFTTIDEDSHNAELGLDMSIYGLGYELVYMNDDDVPMVELAIYSPLNTFIVCDSTVKQKSLFAVNYSAVYDLKNVLKGFRITVYTDTKIFTYFSKDINCTSMNLEEEKEHYFGAIPVIEYKNNKRYRGDFEGVITLIDAYNKLQSDRVNDKEQLVDAFLVIVGQSLGDNEDEVTKTVRTLKEEKIIELDEGGDAKWLVKSLNEEQTEVLKKALKDDIHEFSKVPCLTDENFVGNASGVAMKYKLLGLEQLGRTKERYFKQGLRKRLKLIENIENIRAKGIDSTKIDISMKRTLPVDDELLARIAQETDGFISWETRVKNYDPEIDVEEERKRLDEEKEKTIEQHQREFGSYDFKKGGKEDDNNDLDSDDI